jgi:hypothetical protein
MGVDRSDVESSGDEEDHGFHRLEASGIHALCVGGVANVATPPIESTGAVSIPLSQLHAR